MRETAPHYNVVHGVLLRGGLEGTEVLLGLRKNTGYGDGCYAFPAGHVEPGEKLRDALNREMREEAGVAPVFNQLGAIRRQLQIEHLKDYGSAHEGSRFRHYFENFFVIERWTGVPFNREPSKCADLRFFPIQELPTNMLPLSRFAFEWLQQGRQPVASFGWKNPDFPDWQARHGSPIVRQFHGRRPRPISAPQ